MKKDNHAQPNYRPLVETAKEYGISRSVAFALANDGKLDTFKIGNRRYVFIESLQTLPERLAMEVQP